MASATLQPDSGDLKLRVVLVGIGGATCSGKTTLAKHLRNILPGSVIVHQDDFAPAAELIPIHPVYGVQDWDAPKGAIDWPRMVKTVHEIKETGIIPEEHVSHDHLNEQKAVPVEQPVIERWQEKFRRVEEEYKAKGEKVVWVIVDGFLLYWNEEVVDSLDVRVMLRVPEDVLKQRRHERHGYHTAAQSDGTEGALWRDPPNYWEQIVWPAYVEAHEHIFENGEIERGPASGKVKDLILVEGMEKSMAETIELVCSRLVDVAQK